METGGGGISIRSDLASSLTSLRIRTVAIIIPEKKLVPSFLFYLVFSTSGIADFSRSLSLIFLTARFAGGVSHFDVPGNRFKTVKLPVESAGGSVCPNFRLSHPTGYSSFWILALIMQGREEKQKTANFHRFPQRYCDFPSTSGSSVSLRALAPSFRTFLHAHSENSFLHPLIFDGWMKGTFPFSACHSSSFHLPYTVFEAVFTPFHSSNALSPD